MNKPKVTLRRSGLATAIALASLTTGSQSFAQQPNLFVEEILVTARKQTESLQDVPISLTAFSASDIETQAIETTEDVIKLTPGLTFTRGIGSQDLRPDIRGLTPLSGRANVAILVDGVDFTSDSLVGTGAGQLVSLGLYDLDRIEVVRGPQSALFGRNAFGGAINYITKKPSSTFEGNVNAEVAEWDTYKVKVGVTGPITDNILYRVNVAHSETGGQYSNPETGNNLGEEETQSISATLQFLPTDDLEILTRLDYADLDNGHVAVGVAEANACFTRNGTERVQVITEGVDVRNCDAAAATVGETDAGSRYAGTVSDFKESYIGLSDTSKMGTETELLQWTTLINYEISDDLTFSSNTAYTDMEGTDKFDLDQSPTVTSVGDCPPLPFGAPDSCSNQGLPFFQLSPLVVFPWVNEDNPFNYRSDRDYEREVIFQDFRLSFDAGDDLRWLVGVEYYDEK
ncbi:TonB-dependent receptor [Oceanicoccus sp. KOV_DT_Chl]|uniref:TonB-dependent receptor n=1 Tax=Oceanicoccus sp. KOV_DT_Chl TaxID=1904639 RepID=UPI000C7D2AB9|nr:TonB-dependent receptor plug domain-containing protein [Oceanicoccus sp. KOV_DT_Chl]